MIYLNCCLICCLCEVSRGPQGAKGRDSAPLVNDNESSSLCRNQYLVRHILVQLRQSGLDVRGGAEETSLQV